MKILCAYGNKLKDERQRKDVENTNSNPFIIKEMYIIGFLK